MQVEELIKELKKLDGGAEVRVALEGSISEFQIVNVLIVCGDAVLEHGEEE